MMLTYNRSIQKSRKDLKIQNFRPRKEFIKRSLKGELL